jgi:signal transduction histidine kinase
MMERLQSSRGQLDASVAAQRQLVADASHELRTPVTSLKTNIEVLLASKFLSEDEHQLLVDLVEQADELTELVGDLIELSRGDLRSAPSRMFGLTASSRRQSNVHNGASSRRTSRPISSPCQCEGHRSD